MSDTHLQTIDYPISFGGINVNEGVGADGVRVPNVATSQFRVTRFDPSQLGYRNQKNARHLLSGADVGLATRTFRYLSLTGELVDTTPEAFADREAVLRNLFDLEQSQYAAPLTKGLQALDFWVPTNYAPSGFTSPVRELYMCRPSVFPQFYDRANQGLRESWATQLECPDPTRYLYDPTVKTANSGNSWSVACPNWDATHGAITFPVIRINLTTGAHASAVTLRFTPTSYGSVANLTLALNEAGLNGTHTVDVDMRNQKIIVDGSIDSLYRTMTGTLRDDLRTTAVDSWWGIPANGGTFLVAAGTSNLTSVVVTYRQARS